MKAPVDAGPEARVTGLLVTVPPVGVTVTVTCTDDASDPLAAILNGADAEPTGTAVG